MEPQEAWITIASKEREMAVYSKYAEAVEMAMREEHQAWQTMVRALRDAGAVTDEELKMPRGTTPLINLIREWGNLEAKRQRSVRRLRWIN